MDLTSIPNWLRQRAFLTPERIALTYQGKHLTFSQLDEQVTKRAKQLTTFGVRRNDYVGIFMRNSIEMVVTIHALHYVGAAIVLLNTRLSEREVIWQINDANVTFTICDEEGYALLNEKTNAVLSSEIVSLEETDVEVVSSFSLQKVATIMYTSGTTGNPKGVKQTFGNHWWSAMGSMLNLGLQQEDTWLCAVPIFHISGLSILMRSVIYGMRVVLHPSFQPETMNEAIMKEGVTIVSVVSTMLQQMVEALGEQTYPSTFRCMLLGGGPAPKPLLQKCEEKNIRVFQTYGMTETASQVVTLAPEYCVSKIGSAGKPLFPVEVKIMNDNVECAPFEEGEIVIKGPNVTSGYLNRPDATEKAIRDGWLYSGDIGYMDEEGFLYVLDRRNDLIVSGGENIYPAEIEAVLLSHEAILEAGVVGKKDERWGQVPHAFVVCQQDVTEEELITYCKERLAKYKVPHRFTIVHELPRNAANKLVRRKLQEKLDAQ
ncbi:o-succinylbenzoate--CoA ligase [Bacillus sp. FJAT-47783]|uniref:o-succinylbenzoate--CoA ligase n=1 Tax=Bacillus sp. FJAT-47783 TaxID=2922712 RepID=UPI001FAC1F28|nr:o-succinylbenzoate--CoA ligase [Bacillus sp. FJAT-47783]